MTIDLARKEEKCCSPMEASTSPAPAVYYPSFSFTTDQKLDLPSGEFDANVVMRLKGGDWSEDEKGKKSCTYRFDVMSITPAKSKKKPDKEEPDAAEALMESMQATRAKKAADYDD